MALPRSFGALVSAAALAALLLAGCGDDDGNGAGSATSAAATAGAETTAPATTAGSDPYGGGYAIPPTESPTTAGADMGTGTATVALGDVGGQQALVNEAGFAVYLFTEDTDGTSTCTGACADAWPPVVVEGEPVAGEGLDAAKLATITRDDGLVQVTYNGHPLYTFAGDTAAGQANGQGSGDVWFLVDADGDAIE